MDLYSKDAEVGVLGAVLMDNKALADVMTKVEPEDFYFDSHQAIFTAMLEMSRKEKKIDYITLEHHLACDGRLTLAGGPSQLTALTDGNAFVSNAESYADVVKAHSTARKVSEALHAATNSLDNTGDVREATEVIERTHDRIVRAGSIVDHSRHIGSAYEQLEAIQSGLESGIVQTGFPSIDTDFAPGKDELIIVAARPSTGKSALALAIAENIAGRSGQAVLFESIEMSARTVTWRRWAARTGINLSKFRNRGGLTPEDWDAVGVAADKMKKSPLIVMDDKTTLGQICGQCEKYHRKGNLGAVFIDHLHIMRLRRNDRRDLQLKEATDALARMSKALSVPVFLLCQLNRGIEMRSAKSEPVLADLRDSGAIEEDADSVWLLHRPDRFDRLVSNEMKIIVAKNRNGPVGKLVLRYWPKTGRFDEP